MFCAINQGHNSVSYVKHPHLTFLRRVHVQKAINEMRNLGVYPFKTSEDSMPNGRPSVDNFAQFKVVFHIWYCYFEGLSRSSDLAREVLVYLFHGKCAVRQTKRGDKRSTIIFELRRQYMHGCNIFAKAPKSFAKFINYLALVPAQKMALTDLKFEEARQFCALAELGLRNFALTESRPLGKHAMRSGEDWEKVHTMHMIYLV